ncbi:hypothetical protein PVL29_007118 [Vitis rotundifolia]|uniref:Plastid lipid-associated protein/fibrillin conserved domain-containing protein n=1 Tax=Vitis rotundifolia TaxID=103349 RepID=A0AA39DWA0_VITRO|nr:hypothetical protein PVL29_007118 [Vitis rotundifolia]
MAIEIANLGFQLNPLPTLSPVFVPRTVLKSSKRCRFDRRNLLLLRPPASSLVDEQPQVSFTEPENRLIDSLVGIQGRGRSASPQQLSDVESAVQALEGLGGVPDPTSSSLIEGRWQLMFTTRPGTASPIQRTFVGVDNFSVFQEAAASIKDGKRILFRFDRAAFSFKFLPFKVPYPVPFKLLGDEAKGWLDTTYLSQSGNLRISRGNKGTTFVLQKNTEPRQRFLSVISKGTGVMEAINEFISLNQNKATGEPQLSEGEWQMIWSSQQETDSWLENAANGLMGTQIVKGEQLKFVVDILLGFRFSMIGTFVKTGATTYEVTMNDAAIVAGQVALPMEMESKFNLELLYTDDKIRITRGFRNITFVHLHVG